jgi:hypothetical protein
MRNNPSAKFSAFYNEIDDILSVYDLNKKVEEVFEFSEFFNVSFDRDNCVVGLEIFDASSFFKIRAPNMDFKQFFSKLNYVELVQTEFRNNWFLMLYLFSNDASVEQQLPPFSKQEYKSPLLCSI